MTLRYVYGQDAIVSEFVASLIPHCRRGFGPHATAIGVIGDDGRLMAGMVYYNYDPEADIIEMAGASTSPRWLTSETLRHVYGYPFATLRCQMTVMRVPAENERLLRQLAVYGYDFTLMPRLFGRNRDGVVCTLTSEAWMSNKFNTRPVRAERAEAA